MPNAPDENAEPPPKPRRKKRWLKRLGITALVLVILGFVINGPGARWIAGKVLRDQLAKQGLEGTVTVEGSLASGFALTGVRMEGSASLRLIAAENVSLRWSLPELIDKKFRLAEVNGVEVEIYPSDSPKEEKEGDWRDIFQQLRNVRGIATSGDIKLSDIKVVIHGEDDSQRIIVLQELTHEARSGRFTVKGLAPGKILPNPPPPQDFTLVWKEASMSLDSFVVGPGLRVTDLDLVYPEGGTIEVGTGLEVLDTRYEVEASEQGTVAIRSGAQSLDLAAVSETLGLNLPMGGRVTQLMVDVKNLLENPDRWAGVVTLGASDLSFEERPVPDLALTARVEEKQLTAQLGLGSGLADLDLSAVLPSFEGEAINWENQQVSAELKIDSIAKAVDAAMAATGGTAPEQLPDGALSLTTTLSLQGRAVPSVPDLSLATTGITYRGQAIPDLEGNGSLEDQVVTFALQLAETNEEKRITAAGTYNLASKTYDGSLDLYLRDPAWLGELALPSEELATYRPTGPLGVKWKGSGDLAAAEHRGDYEVETVSVRAPEDATTNASAKGNYHWPGSVAAETLAIRNGQLQLSGGLAWSPHIVTFNKLTLEDGTGVLATVDGSSPANPGLDALFQTEVPLALAINSQGLTLSRLRTLSLPIPEGYEASIDTNLKFAGPPAEPSLNGTLNISEIGTPMEEAPPLALATTFATTEGRLKASSELRDPSGILATLTASTQINSQKWANNPDAIKNLPFKASLKTDKLGFSRLQALSDALAEVEGSIDLDLTAGGTMSDPTYEGDIGVNVVNYPLANTPHQAIRDTTLKAKLTPGTVTILPSTCTIAGGTMTLSGTAGYGGETPTFDLRLEADHALLWRDDLMVTRASGALKLQGTLEAASLTGDLGIVDSLAFKDIELIPLQPAASVAPPSLPSFSAPRKSEFTLPVPEPFANWTLGIDIATKDPFLIRGNLATGQAVGKVSVGGTLAQPRPSGKIDLQKTEAKLPFSTLKVAKGSVVLRPEAPANPFIEVRGKTVVNSYGINVYVYGPVSAIKYNLTSDPPLPESEIMSLIATGTTTEDLADPELARARGFQFVLDDARRRANSAEAGTFLKLMRQPLNAVGELNPQVGQKDPFSGRRFNSVSIDLSEKWSVTAQIDEEGNTRGLLRFSMRSK